MNRTPDRLPPYEPLPEPQLPPWWPWPVAIVAFLAALLGFLAAPAIGPSGPPAWFQPFFAATAGAIAVLFVAVALGTIQISTGVRAAIATVAYIAVGELASLAAICTELPAWLYKFLLALTLGAGIGALLSALTLGARTISNNAWRRREDRLAQILDRTLGDAEPPA